MDVQPYMDMSSAAIAVDMHSCQRTRISPAAAAINVHACHQQLQLSMNTHVTNSYMQTFNLQIKKEIHK